MFTFEEIFFAAVLAFFVTWILLKISKLFKVIVVNSSELNYTEHDFQAVFSRCCHLFPMDFVLFKGQTYRRGMRVKLITLTNKTYVGRLIGQNKENIVCVLTGSVVVAHSLDNILELSLAQDEREIFKSES